MASFRMGSARGDGHDTAEIGKTLRGLNQSSGPPKVIVAHTICGKGASFMEGKVEWHYLPLSDEQYIQAVREIQEAGAP
jgi:transketolase